MSGEEAMNGDDISGDVNKESIYEPKTKPKIIRVLTVLAYILSVSMAAILLSVYYVFVWDGNQHNSALKQDKPLEDSIIEKFNDSTLGKFLSFYLTKIFI